MKRNLKTTMHFTNLKQQLASVLCVLLSSMVMGQIPPNPGDRFCFNALLSEDFGAAVPMGWEGDWMLVAPPLTEGWILQMGPSPDAPVTGADGAFSGDYYAYMETNGPAPINSVFKINTPAISLFDVNASIRFRVLMHGSNIGSLKINVLSGAGFATSETVLTLTGEQHASSALSNWEEVFIDIRQYQNEDIQIEFEGMKLTNNLGDIAIDLVEICSEPRVPTMGQWAVICLGLLFLIFGTIGVSSKTRLTRAS